MEETSQLSSDGEQPNDEPITQLYEETIEETTQPELDDENEISETASQVQGISEEELTDVQNQEMMDKTTSPEPSTLTEVPASQIEDSADREAMITAEARAAQESNEVIEIAFEKEPIEVIEVPATPAPQLQEDTEEEMLNEAYKHINKATEAPVLQSEESVQETIIGSHVHESAEPEPIEVTEELVSSSLIEESEVQEAIEVTKEQVSSSLIEESEEQEPFEIVEVTEENLSTFLIQESDGQEPIEVIIVTEEQVSDSLVKESEERIEWTEGTEVTVSQLQGDVEEKPITSEVSKIQIAETKVSQVQEEAEQKPMKVTEALDSQFQGDSEGKSTIGKTSPESSQVTDVAEQKPDGKSAKVLKNISVAPLSSLQGDTKQEAIGKSSTKPSPKVKKVTEAPISLSATEMQQIAQALPHGVTKVTVAPVSSVLRTPRKKITLSLVPSQNDEKKSPTAQPPEELRANVTQKPVQCNALFLCCHCNQAFDNKSSILLHHKQIREKDPNIKNLAYMPLVPVHDTNKVIKEKAVPLPTVKSVKSIQRVSQPPGAEPGKQVDVESTVFQGDVGSAVDEPMLIFHERKNKEKPTTQVINEPPETISKTYSRPLSGKSTVLREKRPQNTMQTSPANRQQNTLPTATAKRQQITLPTATAKRQQITLPTATAKRQQSVMQSFIPPAKQQKHTFSRSTIEPAAFSKRKIVPTVPTDAADEIPIWDDDLIATGFALPVTKPKTSAPDDDGDDSRAILAKPKSNKENRNVPESDDESENDPNRIIHAKIKKEILTVPDDEPIALFSTVPKKKFIPSVTESVASMKGQIMPDASEIRRKIISTVDDKVTTEPKFSDDEPAEAHCDAWDEDTVDSEFMTPDDPIDPYLPDKVTAATSPVRISMEEYKMLKKLEKDEPVLCDECGQVVKTRHLRSHKKKHLPKNPDVMKAKRTYKPDGYPCPVCPEKFDYNRFLTIHMKRHPEWVPERFLCDTCGKSFVRRETLRSHIALHLPDKPWVCEICAATFKTKRYLGQHKVNTHGTALKKTYTCPLCKEVVVTYSRYMVHRRQHIYDWPNKCPKCPMTFPNLAGLNKHVAHDVCKEKSCDVCHKTWISGERPCSHVEEAHRTKKPWKKKIPSNPCPWPGCTKMLLNNYLLKIHVKTDHEGLRPYKCDVCGHSSKTKSAMKGHMLGHSGKTFPCTVCGQVFSRPCYLPIHMRKHTGERPYACSVCGRSFRVRTHMNTHMRVHTGEKPYVCKICGRGFAQRQDCWKHEAKHPGAERKPHSCRYCGHKFARAMECKKHERTHYEYRTDRKIHHCRICDRAFATSYDVKRHEREHKKGLF